MALASQMARPPSGGRSSTNNPYGSRKRRRKQRLAAGAGLALLGVVVLVLIVRHFTSGAAAAKPDAAGTPVADKGGTGAGAPSVGQRPPLRLDMGKPLEKPLKSAATPPTPPTRSADGAAPDPLAASKPTSPPPPPPTSPAPADPSGASPPVPGAPAAPAPPAVAPPPGDPPSDLPLETQRLVAAAQRAVADNRLVEARALLSRVLNDARTQEQDREGVRRWLSEVNETLLFSPAVTPDDPLCESYRVQAGDVLAKIVKRKSLTVDWRFLGRINRLGNPNSLHEGQTIKIVRGPFHAVVHKSAFRLDLYAGDPPPLSSGGTAPKTPDGAEPAWVYIRSFPVGLGEHGLTPVGSFVVRENSKLINPYWTNPRTGERFDKDDPKNPIGERWLGLVGQDDATRSYSGYGIHGTIDPGSIGKEASMGCVRMQSGDVEVVWEMLQERVSTVRIVP